MHERTPSATTRLFVLLGDPVSHSLSPAIQNAAMARARHDAVYAALRCDRQAVAPLMRALCRAGGGGNVTVPHKGVAIECVERPSEAARRTGACNTFWGADGVICGDNTDVHGFRHAALQLLPTLHGARALVIGAGGAAAAATCTLLDEGTAITLFNRSPDRALALAARLDPGAGAVRVVTAAADVAAADFDLVVNATSLGLVDGDPLPFDLAALGRVRTALDLVYRGDAPTPWVRHARRLGIEAADGTEMLIGQGAAAFARWFGTFPDLDLMRAALPD